MCEICANYINNPTHKLLWGDIHVCNACAEKNLKKAKKFLDYEFAEQLENSIETVETTGDIPNPYADICDEWKRDLWGYA